MHKHRRVLHSWGGDGKGGLSLRFSCSCGDEVERPATEDEQAWLQQSKGHDSIHALWHKCEAQLAAIQGDHRGRTFKDEVHDVMERMRREHPTILRSRCDDTYFASSAVYFVPHESADWFMGYSALYIPQCDEQPPSTMLLHPEHVESMLESLNLMKRMAKHGRRRMKAAEKRRDLTKPRTLRRAKL